MKNKMVRAVVVLVATIFMPLVSYAQSAQVLPKGVSSFSATNYNYFDIDERYNQDGDVEDIAVNLNIDDLNNSIFPALVFFDPLVSDGVATLGRSIVNFTRRYRWYEFAFDYGVTDKLSIGVLLPYNDTEVKVTAELDTTNADVCILGGSLLPCSLGGSKLTADDVQNLLGSQLGINRVETWSGKNIGDIELLGKYQFYNKEDWRLAFTGGLRLPTGKADDPDSLVDIASGDGQTDILSNLHVDYVGIDKLLLNATLSYTLQLPDKQLMRVIASADLPISATKETVDRDLGDFFDVSLTGNYAFTQQWSGGLKYELTKKLKDDYDFPGMEEETDSTSHMALVTLGYSTVQMYRDKKFPIPLSASVTYRNRFAGKNNVTKSQYISLNINVFF